MITVKKIKEYNSILKIHEYSGQRSSAIEKSSLTSDDWQVLGKFYGDLAIIKNKLAGEAYRQKFMDNIYNNCDEEATKYLLNIVNGRRNPVQTDFGAIWKKISKLFR